MAAARARKLQHRAALSNAQTAELLAREAEAASGILVRAFRRAARLAFLWPEEVVDLVAQNRPLTELAGIGPFIEKQIRRWIDKPPILEGKVPPIRRDFFAMADVRKLLSAHPGWPKLLRGDLQMHTRWSDGSGSICEMAQAGESRGYEYIAITDHSKGLKIAGGIDEVALRKQADEIAAANISMLRRGGKFTVLRSIELNLNPNGEGDMQPAAMRRLDLVLGSFHSALRVKHDQTARYLAALRNPDIQILGHPRGRIYNYRLGLTADWPRVFAEADRLDKAVEIDCYPDRQDLNLLLLKIARREGVRISLGADAHHPWQLDFIDLGLGFSVKCKNPRRANRKLHVDLATETVGRERACAHRARSSVAASFCEARRSRLTLTCRQRLFVVARWTAR